MTRILVILCLFLGPLSAQPAGTDILSADLAVDRPTGSTNDGGVWVFDPRAGSWVSSHTVVSCTPSGKGETFRCACLGMVGEVQNRMTNKVWEAEGFHPPPPNAERMLIRAWETLSRAASEEILEKLDKKVPDHCETIAKNHSYWEYVAGLPKINPATGQPWPTCGTACKPERCGCADSACKSHQETEDY